MGLRGDIGKLRELRIKFTKRAELKAAVLAAASKAALKELKLGFQQARDPYGDTWNPLKVGRRKPLRRTGRLMSSFTSSLTPRGFVIRSSAPYAPYHQFGTRTIPARPMLPERAKFGPIWEPEVKYAAETAFKKFWA